MQDRYQAYFLVPPDAFSDCSPNVAAFRIRKFSDQVFRREPKKEAWTIRRGIFWRLVYLSTVHGFLRTNKTLSSCWEKRRFFRRLCGLLHRSLSWPLLKMNNYRRTIYRKCSRRSVRNIRHLRYWFWRYVSSLGKLHLLPISF